MVKGIKNIAASTRARLLNLSQQSGQIFDLVLTRFALERLLYRIGQSDHADRFVLKGAMLLMTWFNEPHRGTRDLDLLGFGDPDPDSMIATFQNILAQEFDDGIHFDAVALRVDRIRENHDYGGLRLRTTADIGGAVIRIVIDIGFGDAVEPGVELVDYPTMLAFPAPRLRSYSRETVIAEKFQAMVDLGRANTRMKDFYDIWILSRSFAFEGDRLARAIQATFSRRGTPIPQDLPDALSAAFGADPQKQQQWRSFVEDVTLDPGNLAAVVDELAAFLMPWAAEAETLDAPKEP